MNKKNLISSILALAGVGAAAFLFWQSGLWDRQTAAPPSLQPMKKYNLVNEPIKMPTEGIKKVVLGNGMTLLMYKTTLMPKVFLQIAYDIGSYAELPGERGLAHLIEHLIFKGTEKLSETDIETIAHKYGASYNAATTMDWTRFYFEVDKNNWRPFVEIFADCMKNARFEEQALNSEMKTVIQELRMYNDNKDRNFFNAAFGLLFPSNHPYHATTIGYKEDLAAISAAQVKAFYKKYYQPNHATLFVIGDINYDEVTAEVTKQFAHLTNDHEPKLHALPHIMPLMSGTTVEQYDAVKSPILYFFWRIPGLRHIDQASLNMAEALLTGNPLFGLHKQLVEDAKVATSVTANDISYSDWGIFFIKILPMPGKLDQCRKIVVKELMRAASEGFAAEHIAAIARSAGKFGTITLQDFVNLGTQWMQSFFIRKNEYDFFSLYEQVGTIKPAQITELISSNLSPLLMNQFTFLPAPAELEKIQTQAQQLDDEITKEVLAKHVRTEPIEKPRYVNELPPAQLLSYTFPLPDRSYTLPNGLHVILHHKAELPLIQAQCSFKEGPHLQRTLAGNTDIGLMMSSLAKGNTQANKDDIQAFCLQAAADIFASTSGVVLSCPNQNLDAIFEQFAHFLRSPTFPASEVAELQTLFQQGAKLSLDNAQAVAGGLGRQAIYGSGHPYGWTQEDLVEAWKKVDPAGVKDLYTKLVIPNNMILSIVGNFDLDQMQELVEKLFGSWQEGSELKPQLPPLAFSAGKQIDHYMLRDQVILNMTKPAAIGIAHQDFQPLRLLGLITFDNLGSRIYQIRERTGLFYTAWGHWSTGATLEDNGVDEVGTIINPENSDKAEAAIRAMMTELVKDGISQAELDSAKQTRLKQVIDFGSSYHGLAHSFAYQLAFNLGFDYYNNILKRLPSITVPEINEVCKKYCKMNDMARIRVGRVGKPA